MSLPAARFPMPHVGAARNQGPSSATCADPKVGGLLWRRQFGRRAVRANDVPHLQRRHLQDLSQAPAVPAHPWATHDRRTGQCSISPCEAPGRFPSPQCSTPAPAVPAALQSSTGSDRTCLEADSAPRHSQPLLRHAGRSAQGRERLFRSVAQSQQCTASIMLHYLNRCI